MASEDDRLNPTMASPPEITWGSHIPNPSASPHIRLRCVLLDILGSHTIQGSIHAFGPPYFSLSVSPPDSQLFFTVYDHTSGPPALLSAYGLHTKPPIEYILFRIFTRKGKNQTPIPSITYTIYAEAEAYDIDKKLIVATNEHNFLRPLEEPIFCDWAIPDNAEEDFVPSIRWDTIVVIVVYEGTLCFGRDGNCLPIEERKSRMNGNLDPLRDLGYLGWPGYVPYVAGVMMPTFREM
jgi:hypothetical protein